MKILSDVNVLAELQENGLDVAPLQSPALTGTPTAPTADSGTNTTQLATTAFVQAALSGVTTSSSAEKVTLQVRFGEAVSKGDPVYISGYHGSTGPVIMSKAKSNDSAKMPAFGLADDDYAENATGYAVSIGVLEDVDTDSYTVGDTLYVAPTGGLTDTKPTGSNLIQNVGTVSRSNANNGSIEVTATGRSNDVPNLTTGKLWVGSANNTIESTTLHLDETNNRLGIGTTSPTHRLDVQGVTQTNGLHIPGRYAFEDSSGAIQIDMTSGDYNAIRFYEGTTNIGVIHGFSSTWQGDTLADSAGAINIDGTNGVTMGAWDDPTFVYDNVNNRVGIGTSTPTRKLHINSGTNDIGLLVESSDQFAKIGLKDNTTTSDAQVLIAASGNDMFLEAGGSEKVRIKSGGSVGIGTTSPDNQLHIEFANTDTAFSGGNSGAWGSEGIRIENTSATTNTMAMLHLRNSDADIHIAGIRQGANDSDLGFFFEGAEKIRFTNSGDVGIGTTSPSQKLEVAGGSGVTAYIHSTGNSAKLDLMSDEDGAGHSGGATYLRSYGWGNSELRIGSIFMRQESGMIKYIAGGSTNVGWTSIGNFGIGTNSPSSKLHIFGADPILTIQDTETAGASSDARLRLAESGASNVIDQYWDFKKEGHNLKFQQKYGTTVYDRFTIDGTNGNATFANDLTVQGDLNVTGSFTMIDTNTQTTEQWSVTNDGTGPAVVINQKGSQPIMDVQDDGTSAFYIEDGGNVGIKTTNPTTTLQVAGRALANILSTTTTSTRDKIRLYDTSAEYTIGMQGGVSYGGLNSDWAMTFQFNNDPDRGFWWGDTGHSTSQGAMALTTQGLLTVASKIRVGYGESDTTSPATYALDASGKAQINGGTGVATTGVLVVRQDGDTLNNGIAITSSNSTSHRIWKDANGKLNIGPSSLPSALVQDLSGNVGIGTDSPGAALDVAGLVQLDYYAAGTTVAHNAGYLRLSSAGKTGWTAGDEHGRIEFYGKDGSGIGARNAASIRAINNQGGTSTTTFEGELAFYTSAYNATETEKLRIDSSGNVGIGETTPLAKLHIKDGNAIIEQGNLYIASSANAEGGEGGGGTGRPTLWFSESEGTSVTNQAMGIEYDGDGLSGNNNRISIVNGSSNELVVFQTGGNVGIGTITPDARLNVADANSGLALLGIFENTTNAGGTSAGIQLRNASDTDVCAVQLSANRVQANAGSDFVIELSDASTGTLTEQFRITEAGKVGIGTNSPTGQLEIVGDDGLYIKTTTNNPTDGAQIRFSDNASGGTYAQYGFIKYKHADTTVETEPTSSGDGFIIGGSEATTVVSIQGHLNVENQTNFENQVEIDSGDLLVRNGDLDVNGQAKIGSGLANARSYYGLTVGFTSNATFSSNADVQDSNRTLSLVNESTTTNTYSTLSFRNSPSSGTSMADFKYIHRGTNDGDLIYTNNNGGTWTDRFSILSDGNVGIGTTSPQAKLDVDGNIRLTGDSRRIDLARGTTSSQPKIIVGEQGTYGLQLRWDSGSKAYFDRFWATSIDGTPSGQMMTFDINNDRIGIGTTSPGEKLEVNGAVIIGDSKQGTATTTLTTTTQTALFTFAKADYDGGKFVITAVDSSNKHITELLVLHDGTTAVATEYGVILTTNSLFSTDVDISGSDVRILVTSASTNSTVYKIKYDLI